MHSLEIVQWDSTRRDHPGYPRRVSGSGLVSNGIMYAINCTLVCMRPGMVMDFGFTK